MSPRHDRSLAGEAAVAVAAIDAAVATCRRVQRTLLAGHAVSKHDASPLTVADLAVQAIVSIVLARELGEIDLVAEEDLSELTGPGRGDLRGAVVDLVRDATGGATSETDVLDAIARGASDGGTGTFWALDPIDGTKGFIRGDQYAIALAGVHGGDVVVGALGCPNLPNPDGTTGVTFVAERGRCEALTAAGRTPISVTSVGGPRNARFVESQEAGHSSHDDAARASPRCSASRPSRTVSTASASMARWRGGAVARGDASIYLRLPGRADHREKIWDHAAGFFVVEQAGGRVTDIRRPSQTRERRTFRRGVTSASGASRTMRARWPP